MMDTKIIRMVEENIDRKAIELAGNIIKSGGLVAFPTETVYGLGGDALNSSSSKKIYAAKGRPSDNPLIIHIVEMSALSAIVKKIPKAAYCLAEKYWPGPLTRIFGSRGVFCSPQCKSLRQAQPYSGKICDRRSFRQDRYDS